MVITTNNLDARQSRQPNEQQRHPKKPVNIQIATRDKLRDRNRQSGSLIPTKLHLTQRTEIKNTAAAEKTK